MSLDRALVRPLVSPLVGPLVGFGGAVWTPAQLFLSGEEGAWYDPSDLSTLWQDTAATTPAGVNDPVGRMDDKSGNGNHATQPTAASRPTLRQSGSLYYLEVDATDDFMENSISLTQRTLASASRFTLTSANAQIYSTGSGQDDLRQRSTSNDTQFVVTGTGVTNTTTVNNVDRVIVAYCDATTGYLRIDQNETSDAVTPGPEVFDEIFTRGATINKWAGRFYGGVIRDAPTTGADLTSLEEYLATKSGVTL